MEHLRSQGLPGCTLTDLTSQIAKIDLQGPSSALILQDSIICDIHNPFNFLDFRGHFQENHPQAGDMRLQDGTPVMVSRSGYTGELGFELTVAASKAQLLWETLLAAGAPHGLIPCGLAARDSLRTSALLPLARHDMGDWPLCNTPWDFTLPWRPGRQGFSKDFIGAQALENLEKPTYTYPFAGFNLRKVEAGAESRVLDDTGQEIGRVLTCVSDMSLGRAAGKIYAINNQELPADFKAKGLSCGFILSTRRLACQQRVLLRDHKREIEVEIVNSIRGANPGFRKPITITAQEKR